ncbi:MAG: hypothetical protein HQK92_07830 [Nitrospirae bacterium]|nr:hypothetical protein [Nitrospirota bacterium]
MSYTIKEAKITGLLPSEMKAVTVDGEPEFIRRHNIKWGEPSINFYALYEPRRCDL